jgi:hypothetical protein
MNIRSAFNTTETLRTLASAVIRYIGRTAVEVERVARIQRNRKRNLSGCAAPRRLR